MPTKEISDKNPSFTLLSLSKDTLPNQEIRELTQNSIEAIKRRIDNGDNRPGKIHWDIDWEHYEKGGHYKLCIIDNGDGMTGNEMMDYLNNISVEGAGKSQGIKGNFGLGAKITTISKNSEGVMYCSWKENRGALTLMHIDDETEAIGMKSHPLDDGTEVYAPEIDDGFKPSIIEENGTKVSLLGNSEEEVTLFPSGENNNNNFIIKYLNQRYFRLPEQITIQCRCVTNNVDEWPKEKPDYGHRTFKMSTICSAKERFDKASSKKGEVNLSNAKVHWWLFDDLKDAEKELNPRSQITKQVGVVYQDEVYHRFISQKAIHFKHLFGIYYGLDHFIIYIEPDTEKITNLFADTTRSAIKIDGNNLEDSDLFLEWAREFKEKMPKEISEKMKEITGENIDNKKLEKRIMERFMKMQSLHQPSKYRPFEDGKIEAKGNITGGLPNFLGTKKSPPENESKKSNQGGKSSISYLSQIVKTNGEPVQEINHQNKIPKIVWVSLADGTRNVEECEDAAALIVGQESTSLDVKANKDFRGYKDFLEFKNKELNPSRIEYIRSKIENTVQEWMQQQLVETIVTVRNLENGGSWTSEEIKKALSPQALTSSLVSSRYFISEKVNRAFKKEYEIQYATAA
jgi:hypothetical protein